MSRRRRKSCRSIIGSEIRLTDAETGAPHARLVLLAQSRRGYGNLAHWITVARRRVEKGHYRAHPGDVEGKVPNAPMLAGLGGCFALLVPAAAQGQAEILAHATWLKTWFQERAAIAVELLHRADDDDLVDHVTEVAARTGLPIVAAGDVLMHVRSRKPLQDTLDRDAPRQAGRRVRPRARAQRRAAPALEAAAWPRSTSRRGSSRRWRSPRAASSRSPS